MPSTLSKPAMVALAAAGAVAASLVALYMWRSSEPAATTGVESHQKGEVSDAQLKLRKAGAELRAMRSWIVKARVVADDAPLPPPSADGARIVKKVHFIRHGEGTHNVAQREWRGAPGGWDGVSEPYTLDTDPAFAFMDAELTPVGVAQAEALRPRAAALEPELMVVSPMRRAASDMCCFSHACLVGVGGRSHQRMSRRPPRHALM